MAKASFTKLQGRYLAFIAMYTEGSGPAADRGGYAALLQGHAADRPSEGGDPGEARADHANPKPGQFDRRGALSRSVAKARVRELRCRERAWLG